MRDLPRDQFTHIPERISGLVDLAYNLWWSWNPEARILFKQLNRQAWKESVHNPVRMLRAIPAEFLQRAAENPAYLHRYDVIMHRFRKYMDATGTWFSEEYPGRPPLSIAYFSAEYGLHHSLPFYAGGLGFLAGDHLKEASDLGLPMVAVGFMYSQGYLHQHVNPDGWQEGITEPVDRDAAPITRVLDAAGEDLVVRVPHIDPPIYVAVWKVRVGRIPLYLLDTNVACNSPGNREISSRLYTGDQEQRLRQEIVLGIGGRKVLHSLGIEYSAVHLNEGHPAFALLERIRERVERGIDFDAALGEVQATSVFTTHTPVPAGHDVFPADLIDRYFKTYYPALGIDRTRFLQLGVHPESPGAGFNMTAFALRASAHHNGVSRANGTVTRKMWSCLWPGTAGATVPIDHVTNGVHVPTWLNPRMKNLYDRYIGPISPGWLSEHDDPAVWELIDEIPDDELWRLHLHLKAKLISRLRERERVRWTVHSGGRADRAAGGAFLNPSVLTIGFARRFSTYKRAQLIFEDPERLKRILNNPWYPVQIVFAGKAHPADDGGKRVLQKIYRYAQQPEFAGRIAFVEDYGEQVAQYLVHGVDVWLNNPLPPMEASGTSGMKAALNGVLNLSILDGWWIEGYNGRNGWAFGNEETGCEGRDRADASAIYDLLEKEVVPLYYDRSIDDVPHGWVRMMKESIKSNGPRFSARRMVKEYVTRYYPSLLKGAGGEFARTGAAAKPRKQAWNPRTQEKTREEGA
ncbi:glycosyltransferase family 1 protein [Methanoculleus sp. Wushi-C6]|uniref:glycogen phosphorylase n=1 Tax=Methanoculleus caldifontis TaxID=2651577 RepID=A0ABU3X2X2_9EURY|nr:alpha-glucan family phosphorylase [Methanoculleus sp. Wushi-C6]MDV2482410.1 glycosyltransferase family 1 protein [Methanoculleus sp. Wushi-C6]